VAPALTKIERRVAGAKEMKAQQTKAGPDAALLYDAAQISVVAQLEVPVMVLARASFACAFVVALSGCAINLGEASPPPAAASAPAPGPATPAPALAPYAGLASGPLGDSLDAADRTAANNAEIAALNSGDRKSWRGDGGSYGYVAPGAANGDCRDVSHTIYINGRPKVGKGTACKTPDGWRLNS
jgi:surface antigen